MPSLSSITSISPATAAIAVAVALALGFTGGWTVHTWKEGYDQKQTVEDQAKKFSDLVGAANARAGEFAQAMSEFDKKKQVISKEFHHEIEKVEYRSCIIPSTGYELYERASQGDTSVRSDLSGRVREAGEATP